MFSLIFGSLVVLLVLLVVLLVLLILLVVLLVLLVLLILLVLFLRAYALCRRPPLWACRLSLGGLQIVIVASMALTQCIYTRN